MFSALSRSSTLLNWTSLRAVRSAFSTNGTISPENVSCWINFIPMPSAYCAIWKRCSCWSSPGIIHFRIFQPISLPSWILVKRATVSFSFSLRLSTEEISRWLNVRLVRSTRLTSLGFILLHSNKICHNLSGDANTCISLRSSFRKWPLSRTSQFGTSRITKLSGTLGVNSNRVFATWLSLQETFLRSV